MKDEILQPLSMITDEDRDNLDDMPLEEKWRLEYQTKPYKELAARMVELWEISAEADDAKKLADKELDVIRLKVVPQRFAEDGYSSLNIPGVGRLGLTKDAYCTQKKEFTAQLFEWLRENEYGDLIKDTVNPSSLKSLVKELFIDDTESQKEFEIGSDADDETAEKSKFEEISEYVNFTPFMRAAVTKK